MFATDFEILKLVNEKQDWIFSKQKLISERISDMSTKEFVDGENYYYLGTQYPLVIIPRQNKSLVLEEGCFKLRQASINNPRNAFINWYRAQARKIFTERVNLNSSNLGLAYNSIRVTGAQTRWGSCGSGGSLNFSWRLVMAPLDIIDYVIIHELAHLLVRDHSKKFWSQVESWQPDFQERRRWLKENGYLYNI
jgi:predicted metal-dependent hydrolase